ncbi:MAG: alanine/ornithine racemase family PLP-dependent enzyme [Clostridium sp.]|nr:alanine/ornithine racemase family PLP-dependent enzyme [Clostridium sp.]
MFPKLIIDINKLRDNLDWLVSACHKKAIEVAVVTKVFCADEKICMMIDASQADSFADSRLENLEAIATQKPKQLLRIPMQSEIDRVIRTADISMQSSVDTIQMSGDSAIRQDRIHKVILMVDLGDLREGIFNSDEKSIIEAADAIVNCKNLEFYGVGVNLTCYGGILPDENNLGRLLDIAAMLRKRYALPIPVISGGNSSMMTMLRENRIPIGINQLRLGESFVLGNDTSTGLPMPELHTDCFVLEAELVEVQRKPSKPIGTSGLNAFGEHVEFEDRGEMIRGILAIGRQDVNPDGLKCLDPSVEILGASSDHLIVNLTNARLGGRGYKVGDTLKFIPDYGALLRLTTSKYVTRDYIGG